MGGRVSTSRNRHRSKRWISLAAVAAPIASLVVVAGAATPAAASAPSDGLYAYADGAGTPADCPAETTSTDGCSLTEALSQVAAGGTVLLATDAIAATYNGTWTISTSGTSPSNPVTIEPATGVIPGLDGLGGGTVLTIGAGVSVTINQLNITGGNGAGGGAIANGVGVAGGTLTVTDSTFDANTANDGGAIDNADGASSSGTVIVIDSTFSGNTAHFDGGAIDNADEGGNGTVTVSTSTFSANSATDYDGGAIDNADSNTNSVGTLTVTGSTFSGDQAAISGAGIANSDFGDNAQGTGVVWVADNIFNDTCARATTPSSGSAWNDAGYNVSKDGSCNNESGGGGAGDTTYGVPAVLGTELDSLSNNGGPTQTIALLTGNAAIAHVPSNTSVTVNSESVSLCPRVDQRGVSTTSGTACNTGALDTGDVFAYADGSDYAYDCSQTGDTSEGCSLADALMRVTGADQLFLATSGDDGEYVGNWTADPLFTDSSDVLDIKPLAGLSSQPILDGNDGANDTDCTTAACNSAILSIGNTAPVYISITGVTFMDANDESGSTDDGIGGAIDLGDQQTGSSLTVADSTFSDNSADFGGGAIAVADLGGDADLTVTRSTFDHDTAGTDGGAIDMADAGSGTATISDSTFFNDTAAAGGAILNAAGSGGGAAIVVVTGSTFSENDALAAATGNIGNGTPGTIGIAGDLFNGSGCLNSGGTVDDAGYNADTDNSCEGSGTADVADPNVANLSTFGNHGGPTKTQEPIYHSNPAIGLVPTGTTVLLNAQNITLCERTDQRGVDSGGAACNAGSVDSISGAPPAPGSPGDGGPSAGGPSVSVTGSPNPSTYGQSSSFTATIAGGASCGTVQWIVDGTPSGSPVSVTTGTTGANGTTLTFTPPAPLGAGSHQVQAVFTPCSGAAGTGSTTEVVNKAATTLTLSVTGSTATATVKPVAPGAGTPTGTVTFTVDGQSQPPVTLSGGVATLTLPAAHTATDDSAKPADTTPVVTAAYSGDGNFTGSSGTTAVNVTNPTITAKVTSAHAKTSYGWYRSPVTVTFTCTVGSSPLAAACPAPVTLSGSGAAQSVTKTITDTDGGTTTVVVSPINIDKTKPSVKVTGAKSGHTYSTTRHLTCKASDKLSGVASCTIHKTHTTHNGIKTVHYTASAKDKAGNTTTKKGHYRIS